MRSRFRSLAPLVLLLTALACSGGDTTGTTPIPDPTATDQVAVRDDLYSPLNAEIASGSTMTWTWQGRIGHDVVFEDGVGSSGVQTAGTHTRTFTTPGTYRYRCTLHSSSFTSGMVGQVVVQ